MTYRLSQPHHNVTRLEINLSLKSIPPMALWEFWTRPYGEDYADHLANRISGQKDRSVYGAILKRNLKKLARKTGKLQPA